MMSEVQRQTKLHEYTELLISWTEGSTSHWNEMLAASPGHRAKALMLCTQADAAEVAKLSSAIQALVALDNRPHR